MKKSFPKTWRKAGNTTLLRAGDNAYSRSNGIGCNFEAAFHSYQYYIHNVLELVAIPYLQLVEYPIFQKDNDISHIAPVKTKFIHDSQVDIIPWPAMSHNR